MRLLFLLRLLLLLLHFRHSFSAPMSEYHALLSLKSAISDDPQPSLSSWNASTSHCFPTMSLTFHFSLISPLLLISSRDPFRQGFFIVADLRFLNLSNNVFNGTFPVKLSQLKNLEVLDLYNPENSRSSSRRCRISGICISEGISSPVRSRRSMEGGSAQSTWLSPTMGLPARYLGRLET